MIITINGMPGAGKGTAAKYLAKKLGLKYYSMGDMRGEIAKEKGLTIAQLNKLGEKERWTDKLVDDFQKKLQNKDNLILDGRLSWHFIPNSIKILFLVNLKEGSKRIFQTERKDEKYKNLKDALKAVKERINSDMKRYKKYYGIKNIYGLNKYDIVIDTSYFTIGQMCKKVLKAVKAFER